MGEDQGGMNRRTFIEQMLMGSTVLLSLSQPEHSRRYAVVVGIDTYSKLDNGNLTGCVADANDMAKLLKKLGFQVKLLLNADATRRTVMAAIHTAALNAGKDGQLLFYFAGHGAKGETMEGKKVKSYILMADTSVGNAGSGLDVDDLYHAVVSVPTKSQTVLLDSCFSAAMIGGLQLEPDRAGLKARCYNFLRLHEEPISANRTDGATQMPGSASVCYFTACAATECAWEQHGHGVFTKALIGRLQIAPPNERWGQIQKDVSIAVSNQMFSLPDGTMVTQHPQLTSHSRDLAVIRQVSQDTEHPCLIGY